MCSYVTRAIARFKEDLRREGPGLEARHVSPRSRSGESGEIFAGQINRQEENARRTIDAVISFVFAFKQSLFFPDASTCVPRLRNADINKDSNLFFSNRD